MFNLRRAAQWVGAGALLATAFLSTANAEWSSDVTRDQAGRLKVAIMGDVEGGRAIYATCDTTRNALLALLVPMNDPGLATTGMTLTFAFADGSRWASTAALYRYDNDMLAVGYGTANDVPAIVQALAAARDSVRVALAVSGQTRTWTADVKGSTAAARKFLDNCFATN